MDAEAYMKECAAAVQKQFVRRSFEFIPITFIVRGGKTDGSYTTPLTVECRYDICLQSARVGFLLLNFIRQTPKRRRENGSITHGTNHVQQFLHVEISGINGYEIVHLSQNFRRPRADHKRGRPPLRKWAAHAAKVFTEKYMPEMVNTSAEYVHES